MRIMSIFSRKKAPQDEAGLDEFFDADRFMPEDGEFIEAVCSNASSSDGRRIDGKKTVRGVFRPSEFCNLEVFRDASMHVEISYWRYMTDAEIINFKKIHDWDALPVNPPEVISRSRANQIMLEPE